MLQQNPKKLDEIEAQLNKCVTIIMNHLAICKYSYVKLLELE